MSLQKLVVGASGIYVAYLSASVLAEKLYSTPYASIKDPSKSDLFNYPGLMVWFSSLLCAIFGFVRGKMANQPSNPISRREQLTLGLLYTVNILAANYALLYVSYLTQTIGRNCRYLLVVIVGAFFSRVKKGSALKLPPQKVLVALVITTGVLLFTLLKTGKEEKRLDDSQAWKGYLLLALSVTSDALFSDSQAYSKANFRPTANHLFASANFLTFAFVLLFSLVQGQAVEQISFCLTHPAVILDVFLLGVLQVLGQVSIYYVIANFKQHIFPLISTTRKVFTVLLSIFIYHHSVNWMQWLSIFLVFGGLGYELWEEIETKKEKEHHSQQKKQ